jgi:PAS domain-containing protein
MRRFVLQQNVSRFERALETERDELQRGSIREMLASCRRELALVEAELLGAQAAVPGRSGDRPWREEPRALSFLSDFDAAAHPCIVLDPRPGLAIVDINAAHRKATHAGREAIGRPVFQFFPDNPADSRSESIHNFYRMLRAASNTGQTQTMPAHRYDVRAPEGHYLERYWRSETTPLLDDAGRLMFLLHKSEDVTADVLAPPPAAGAP